MSMIITWNEDDKLVIRDVHAKWHERVLNFMLEHYYKPHRLYSLLRMNEDDAVTEDYLNYLRHLLLGECCIVTVPNDDSNEIQAVAIIKWMSREWRSWTVLQLIPNTPQWSELLTLQTGLLKSYAEAHPKQPFDSLHLFEYFVCDALRDDPAFMDKFFDAICQVARHMGMPRVTFVAMSMLEQRHASEADFIELGRILYSMYLNRQRCRPFSILRDLDEMFVALYERKVEPLICFRDMPGFEELIERMRIAALKGLTL